MTTVKRHVCNPDCWYVAKRRGRMVRGRNRCTGEWEPHWWPEGFYPRLVQKAVEA